MLRGTRYHNSSGTTAAVAVAVLLMVCLAGPCAGYLVPGARYCQARPGQRCCAGRDDACTMPIYDTVCYCDAFCNRTVHDCCPDFWGYCMGIRPPPGSLLPPQGNSGGIKYQHGPQNLLNNCLHNGKLHYPGDQIRENCNNCTCVKEMVYEKEYNWKCTQKVCVIRSGLINKIGEGNYGWKASNYSFLWGMELHAAVTYRLGTIHPEKSVMDMSSMKMKMDRHLPENFDSRQKWQGMILDIRDQGNCASSWAFSTASVASDRIAIQSHGGMVSDLSPQHLISCNTYQQKACHGGHLDRAWWYIRKAGVVTDECYPYHSGYSMKKGHCYIRPYTSPARLRCPTHTNVRSDIYKTSPPYRISSDPKEIMKEIMENGPVQATMEVREDFFMYRTGVYHYSLPAQHLPPHQRRSGYHSVKIIGWGVDRSQGRAIEYWLCANSWGKQWGEDGYFRIRRGVNECDIEAFVVGVWGKITGRMMRKPYRHRFYNDWPHTG